MLQRIASLALLLGVSASLAQETTPEAVRLAERLASLNTDADRNQVLTSEDIPVTPALFWALRQRADVIFYQAGYPKALELYQFVLALSDRMQNSELRDSALFSIAGAKNAMGQYEEAAELYTQSLAISRRIGDPARIQRRLGNLAIVELDQGDYTSATAHVAEAMSLSRRMGDKLTIAINTNTMARIQKGTGDYRGALDTYNTSLALAEELKARDGIAFVLNNIGALYLRQGDLQLAAQYLERSFKLKEEIGNKTAIVNGLINLGEVYHRLGRDDIAAADLRRAIQLAEAEGNQWGMGAATLNLASVEHAQGNLQQALDQLNNVVRLGEAMGAKPLVANALQGIAEFENEKGDHSVAAAAGGRAVVLARELSDPDLIGKAGTAAGRANLNLGNRDQARAYFVEAVGAIEGLRGNVAGGDIEEQAFFGPRLEPYQEMMRMSVSEKHPDQALQFAERAKARVILDAVSRSRTSLTKPMTPAEKAAETDFRARTASLAARMSRESSRSQPDEHQLAALGRRLDAVRLEYTAFENTLYSRHPELRLERFEVAPPTVAAIVALLQKHDAAVVEFAVTGTVTYVFLITARSSAPSVFLLPITSSELAIKVRRFRDRLAARDLGFSDSARELYRLLLGPLSGELRRVTTMAVIPDGPLWELPFAALENARDHFLIEDYDLFYAPSLTVLSAMLRRSALQSPNTMPTILAMGNPTAANLPHAATEVEALAPIYGASHSRIYTGAEARKERLQSEAGRHRIVHLAAHGVIDDRNPMYSFVALAGNGKENGLLEAREMMDLDLHADLVVLSGCDTARGELSNGEGIVGMSWALFIAGSSATLASSWKVDSESTMQLMIEFHRNLRSGVHTPAHSGMSGALRAAALQVMNQQGYRHPYFWAGFALVGQVF
jgi:CHAT domain-containing protein/Tfp pilus assembly protein PilF